MKVTNKNTETYEGKSSRKNGILRLVFVALSFLLETVFIGLMFTRLAGYAEVINILLRGIGIILVLVIYAQNTTASMRMPWIILILSFPIFGTAIYLTIGLNGSTMWMRKRFEVVDQMVMSYLSGNEQAVAGLKEWDKNVYRISSYINDYAKYPLYEAEKVTYFANAIDGLEAQKKDIQAAKSFIFMEYFAIENDKAWSGIEELLIEKVKEGVEVRVFYDDIGSIGYVNLNFAKRLQSFGIKCIPFNPCGSGLKLVLNYRDHRKMTIIDGKVAYTGGYNLANEYFGITTPFGRWKDTGVRIEGEAVKSFVVSFLGMWHFDRKRKTVIDPEKEILPYLVNCKTGVESGGNPAISPLQPADKSGVHTSVQAPAFIQPYADTPLDQENVGEEVYISIINKATDYCYFITPYLVITDEMQHAFILAAKRGVDVRIITPGIPDKKVIYQVTRSFYHGLVKNGVRIFEWTPGFCHAKMCVADDQIATCGTINLDYRSLYHHFEVGCLMIGGKVIQEIKEDFDTTMAESREVTAIYQSGRSSILRLGQMILRLFAELL